MMMIHRQPLAVKAEYKEQVISDYSNNPLIESLPEILLESEAVETLTNYPSYSPLERTLLPEYRCHYVQRLFRYFEPLDKHLDLEQRISRVIRQGYIDRNPFCSEFAAMAHKNYDIIKKGDLCIIPTTENTTSGFTLIGYSGVGKSTGIRKVLSLYPQVIVHSNYHGQPLYLYQIAWLKIDCPFDGSVKGLCVNFFDSVDRLLGTDYKQRFAKSRITADLMLSQMSQIAMTHCLGVLVVDEIQHLNMAKSGGADKMLNFFVTLVNTIGVPVILIGTNAALSVLQKEFRQARRGTGQGDMIWEPIRNDDMWDVFINQMWKYQWTSEETPLTDELKNTLYEESQGIIDIAVKLYAIAQWELIAGDDGKITPDLIKRVVYDHLKLLKPMMEALKSGDIKRIEKYEDIKPIDVETILDQTMQKIRAENRKSDNKSKEKTGDISLDGEVIRRLVAVGIKPERALTAVQKVSDKSNIECATQEALQLVLIEEKPNTGSLKNKKQDPSDMRVITNKARNKGKSAYDALQESGFIEDSLDDFTKGI